MVINVVCFVVCVVRGLSTLFVFVCCVFFVWGLFGVLFVGWFAVILVTCFLFVVSFVVLG